MFFLSRSRCSSVTACHSERQQRKNICTLVQPTRDCWKMTRTQRYNGLPFLEMHSLRRELVDPMEDVDKRLCCESCPLILILLLFPNWNALTLWMKKDPAEPEKAKSNQRKTAIRTKQYQDQIRKHLFSNRETRNWRISQLHRSETRSIGPLRCHKKTVTSIILWLTNDPPSLALSYHHVTALFCPFTIQRKWRNVKTDAVCLFLPCFEQMRHCALLHCWSWKIKPENRYIFLTNYTWTGMKEKSRSPESWRIPFLDGVKRRPWLLSGADVSDTGRLGHDSWRL